MAENQGQRRIVDTSIAQKRGGNVYVLVCQTEENNGVAAKVFRQMPLSMYQEEIIERLEQAGSVIQGPQGKIGPQGIPGIQGPQGNPGASVYILGRYDTAAQLRAAHPVGNIGDGYLIGEYLWTWLQDVEDWGQLGKIAGPAGPQGIPGVGIAGIEKTGSSGLIDTYTITMADNTSYTFEVTNGRAGDAGSSIASIAKTSTEGLVDTYTITLTNGHTATFTVTNGAQGLPGTNGNPGPQGTPGVGISSITKTGTSGLIDTYTITLTNGATATFEVKNGDKGDTGETGATGPAGYSPIKGVDYFDGSDADCSAWLNRNNAVNVANTNYSQLMARGTSLHSTETTPTVNGTIAWQYG